jgi:hypothetical protein
MSAILKVTAEVEVAKSSSLMAAVYEQIAVCLPAGSKLGRWLADVARRGSPFLDISLFSIPPDSRRDFVSALPIARAKEERPEVKCVLGEIERCVQDAVSHDPDFVFRPLSDRVEDLDQVWFGSEENRANQPLQGTPAKDPASSTEPDGRRS